MISDDEYKIFTRLLDNMSPSRLNEVITVCEEYVSALKQDPCYDRLLAAEHLTEILLTTQLAAYGGEDDTARMWLSTLKTVARSCDFHLITTQFALFVISQEHNKYRIHDDQLRLLVTYTHVKILSKILEDQQEIL